jgi:hypothetical protein
LAWQHCTHAEFAAPDSSAAFRLEPVHGLIWKTDKETIMKGTRRLIPATAILLALTLGLYACKKSQERVTAAGPSNTAPASSSEPGKVDLLKEQRESEQQTRPDLEQRRVEAQREADKSLDEDAIAAIHETHNAVKAINENKIDEARAAIERATGWIDILLARNKAAALIPVWSEVIVIDAAPRDVNAIRKLRSAVDAAVADKDYSVARVLLHQLASEIRVRTYDLPFGTYPDALKTAARLLDQKQTNAAIAVLLTALNTLAIVDKVQPLPTILAQRAVNEAEQVRDRDKQAAQLLLAIARNELQRARLLGYAGKDPEYAALDTSISDLEKKLKGTEDTRTGFAKLKDRLGAFFKKQSSELHKSG